MRLFIMAMLLALYAGPVEAQTGGPRKKLIEYGWDVPYPDFVRQNIRAMEQRPFDGIVLRCKAGWNVFLHKPYDPAKFAEDEKNLRGIPWEKFADNFLLVWATADEGWDWLNETDWKAAESNIRLLARLAREGCIGGICFDPEPYGNNVWQYSKQPHAKELSFEQYAQKVRRRGAQFMRALQKELSAPKILTFFHVSLFGSILDDPDPASRMRRLSAENWGLLPAFLDGMLDAANPNARLIDGNELAYYYTAREPFFRAYHTMRQRALSLVAPENRRKYALQVQAGSALYMDQLFALREPVKGFLSYYMAPEERSRFFEHNAYYALYTSDEYVWCYSERMSWWSNQVPPGAEEALRRAKEKIAGGRPLGFDIDEMIRAAQKKMQERSEADLIRRTAAIPKLRPDEKPPAIDGKLDDPVWSRVPPLESLLPTLASGQKATQAQTTVKAAWDDSYLYAAFRCEEPQREKLSIVGEKRDDPLWMGDVVELFVGLSDKPGPFRQFMVNPKGVAFDQAMDGEESDLSFDPDWKAAAAAGPKGWTVEMAVPWSALGGAPKPGETRRANVGRERKPVEELSTWSQVVIGFLDPSQFGTWVFQE
jgi:hypothetical protein